jgi:tRNA modification GTPase
VNNDVFSTADTIVAIATPPGRGGLGVVRLSGPAALAIVGTLISRQARLAPRHATLTKVSAAGVVDDVVATYFPAPASYTGDDVVELSAHGSPVVLKGILAAAVDGGARLAEPGEFTLRAYLNGRIDLIQAEAVADLVDAVTPLQARAAYDQLQGTLTGAIEVLETTLFDLIVRLEASVDFPDEGYHFVEPGMLAGQLDMLLRGTAQLMAGAERGRLVREGFLVAIVGPPNAGKSSLFNALVGAPRAIVADTPGTTRDLVTEVVDLEGLRVTIVDTAGLRETIDGVEAQGVERALGAERVADLVLVVGDTSNPEGEIELERARSRITANALVVGNKSDLPAAWNSPGAIKMSAATGAGLDEVRVEIIRALESDEPGERPEITNVRHIALVRRAQDALARSRAACLEAGGALPEEFVLADLQEARAALEEITGKRTPDEVLEHIFARFCIGK